MFVRSGSEWVKQGGPFLMPERPWRQGGTALSEDGDTALIGAYVFTRSGSSWTKLQRLAGGPGLGTSVALSSSGTTAFLTYFDSEVLFARSGSGLFEQTQLIETELGRFVALSGDANTALVASSGFEGGALPELYFYGNAGARVSLASSTIRVSRQNEAAIILTCTGAASCGGSLTLSAVAKIGRASRIVTIGAISGSIPSGKTTTVELRLNATGRMLLLADHGKLPATLTILKFTPAPVEEQVENVSLVEG